MRAYRAGRIADAPGESADVRNRTLHQLLEAFTTQAADKLEAETADGAEVSFELVEEPGGSAPLYCYRPLTGDFLRERHERLTALPTYAPVARMLATAEGLDAYLRGRAGPPVPAEARERADVALRVFLGRVFAGRSEFGFDLERFDAAYAALELALYEGSCRTTVIAPLLGVTLDPDTDEVPLGDGLSLQTGDSLTDAPSDAVWGESDEPNVLIVLTVTGERTPAGRSPISTARVRFRRALTALRLFERGGYALGPLAWARADVAGWRPFALGSSGRPRGITVIPAGEEDELRAFCSLISRRTPSGGELAWALARFEMGRERLAPFEALTDYLLALRALLEPEGPASGRLAQRLAVLCAKPDDRIALAERTAHAISLERAVISGLAPAEPGADALVEELSENLRALLRDVLCGHLDADLREVADFLLAESAAVA
ncbi:MAG: hypothetical protein M3065_09020 [Actinomycetota bacterium]|nr:hypothetical protein [Actinomycetota bacterium]